MTSLSKIAKKHLGQNFLIDDNIKQRIIDAVDPSPDDSIVEIGPGLGALTEKLAASGAEVFAIEKDHSLAPHLKNQIPEKNFHLIQDDFLKYDLTSLPAITKVIGNIPYNISTPIIEHLLNHRKQFDTVFLTTQREFAKRLTAKPGTKDYGSLTCYAQYHADIKILFKISAQCFRPVPKVMSCFLKLNLRKHEPPVKNEIFLFKLIHTAFQQRRKKISNALAGLLDKDALESLLNTVSIKSEVRADHLSLDDYILISNLIFEKGLIPCHPTQKTNA